jgi:cytochrome P450
MDCTTLKVAAAIVAVVCASGLASRYLSRQRLAQRYGCQPVWRSLSKDPLLGLDTLPGTIRTLWQHKMLQRSCEYYATLGTTFTVKELTRRGILTIEPENIKTVLTLNFEDYALGHRLEAFRPLLGEGIFDTDGKHWSHSRALLRPSFTRDHIADLTTLEDHFQNLLLLLPRDGESVFDLLGPFFRYTLDSATEFLFGETTGTLRQASSTLGFAEAFHYAQKAVIVRATLGPLRFLYRDRKADKSNRICRDFARRYVDKAYQTLEDERSGHGKAKSEKHVFSRELAARTSDRERVLDEVMNVLLAGRDTTASLLSNLFFMLAKHSDIWGKLRAEVAVLQGRIPNYDELQSLKYVQCCINECKKPS